MRYEPVTGSGSETWESRNYYTSLAIFTPRTNPPWTWRVQWREEREYGYEPAGSVAAPTR